MAEIRPDEQSEKTDSCRENLWNEIQLKSQLVGASIPVNHKGLHQG